MTTRISQFVSQLLYLTTSLVILCLLMSPAAKAQSECLEINESALIQPPIPTPFQQFGWSVSAFKNVSIIGALEDFSEGTGAAYVYRENTVSGDWDHEATLTPLDGIPGDQFGYAVANNGVWAVIGSRFHGGTGAVYVFHYDGTSWDTVTKLQTQPGDLASGDEFGFSVALDNDVIAVGARNTDHVVAGSDVGSIYVFRYNGTNWVQEAKLFASDLLDLPSTAGALDRFGESVSLNGNRLGVGAPFNDEHSTNTGAAYVFEYDGTNWDAGTKILPTLDGLAQDNFGTSISVSGDAVLIGSPKNNGAFNDQGAAYVFRKNGAAWAQEAKLTSGVNNEANLSNFGWSVALEGSVALVSQHNSLSDSAYAFAESNQSWSLGLKLKSATGANTSTFSQSLALDSGKAIIGESFGANVVGVSYAFSGMADCNGNGVLDCCDIIQGTSQDCNNNGIPDECDISSGIDEDCNGNGIPDSCDAGLVDCDGNGTPDCEQIALDSSLDCNGNLLLDSCEVTDHWNLESSFVDPVSGRGVSLAAASLIDGKIYVSHGTRDIFFNGPDNSLSNKLSIYTIATDTWDHNGATTNERRKDLGGAVAFNRHYAIGGWMAFNEGGTNSLSNLVEEYDPLSGNWTPKTSLPNPLRAGMGCASFNDQIYVVGGRTGDEIGLGTILGRLDRFDPFAGGPLGQWTQLANMPIPVSDCSATIAYNGKIYVFGGAIGPLAATNSVQIYDIATGLWSTGGNLMPSARAGAMAGVVGGSIAVFGGVEVTNFGGVDAWLPVTTVNYYHPVSGTWTSGPDIPLGTWHSVQGVTWDDSGVYSIGSRIGTNEKAVQVLLPPLLDCNNNLIPDDCDIASGFAIDCNTNGIPDRCEVKYCRADIYPICPPQPQPPVEVNIDDLVAVLNAFGPCVGCPEDFMPDFDPNAVPVPLAAGDGVVDIEELVAVLNNFGPCTPGGNGATAITLVQMDFSNGFMFADGSIDAASASLVSAAWVANQAGSSPVDVYRVFAQVSGLTATLTYCGGGTNSGPNGTPEPLVLNPGKGGQFFIPIANTYAPVNVALLSVNGGAGYEYFQSQAYGTFLALGSASNAIMPSKQGNTAGLDAILSGSVNEANAGWSVTPVAGQGVISDGNGGWQVLIGQFAVPAGKTLTVAVRLVGDGIDIYATTNSGVLGGP